MRTLAIAFIAFVFGNAAFVKSQDLTLMGPSTPEDRYFYLRQYLDLRNRQNSAETTACLAFRCDRQLPMPDDQAFANLAKASGINSPQTALRLYGTTNATEAVKRHLEGGYRGKFLTRIYWWPDGCLVEFTEPSRSEEKIDADTSTVWFDSPPDGVVRVEVTWAGNLSYAMVSTNPFFDPVISDLLGTGIESMIRSVKVLSSSGGRTDFGLEIQTGRNGEEEVTTVTRRNSNMMHVTRISPSHYVSHLASDRMVKYVEYFVDPNVPRPLSVRRFIDRQQGINGKQAECRVYERIDCSVFSGRSLLAFLRRSNFELTSTLQLLASRGITIRAQDGPASKLVGEAVPVNKGGSPDSEP